jgi:hypothetical protein
MEEGALAGTHNFGAVSADWQIDPGHGTVRFDLERDDFTLFVIPL